MSSSTLERELVPQGAAGTGRLWEVPGEMGEPRLSAGFQQVYFLYPF